MATKAKRPCSYPGCGVLTSSGRCESHRHQVKEQRKQSDHRRGSAHSRGYDSRWSAYSKAYRKRNPLCVLCRDEGRVTLATCVDHITPVVGGQGDAGFWVESNHRGLCWMHHSSVTASQDGGFGNVKGKGKARQDCGVDGIPTDSRSHWNK